jgi:hypothetical protein
MGESVFDVNKLKSAIVKEMENRRVSREPGEYSYYRHSNPNPLSSATGAVKLHAALGIPIEDWRVRISWAERINSFQETNGTFDTSSGKQHAAGEAIAALNILGGVPGRPVRHLAPFQADKIKCWLKSLDWSGTHKDFCAGVAPVIASGLHSPEWTEHLTGYIRGLVSPENPLLVWCVEKDDPWRVISCIYHVTHGLDAGFIPYPFPELIWDRLAGLDYENRREDLDRTVCTDFDYMFILSRIAHQMPGKFAEFISRCTVLFDKLLEEWSGKKDELLSRWSTHELACYLVGWSILQRALPGRFSGPVIYDIQNAPWLYRLPSSNYFAY